MKITNNPPSNPDFPEIEVGGLERVVCSNSIAQPEADVIDLLQHDKMTDEKLIRLHSRFEQIIESQIYLMLQRGVPAGKLASIVKKMDMQLKLEAADEVLKAAGQ